MEVLMIERFASHHPYLLTAASLITGVLLAVPVAWAGWHYIILPGLVQEAQIAEGKRIIVQLAGTDKNCLDWREKNGGWSCVRR